MTAKEVTQFQGQQHPCGFTVSERIKAALLINGECYSSGKVYEWDDNHTSPERRYFAVEVAGEFWVVLENRLGVVHFAGTDFEQHGLDHSYMALAKYADKDQAVRDIDHRSQRNYEQECRRVGIAP